MKCEVPTLRCGFRTQGLTGPSAVCFIKQWSQDIRPLGRNSSSYSEPSPSLGAQSALRFSFGLLWHTLTISTTCILLYSYIHLHIPLKQEKKRRSRITAIGYTQVQIETHISYIYILYIIVYIYIYTNKNKANPERILCDHTQSSWTWSLVSEHEETYS